MKVFPFFEELFFIPYKTTTFSVISSALIFIAGPQCTCYVSFYFSFVRHLNKLFLFLKLLFLSSDNLR